MSQLFIYVLELQQGKYYIGKTRNPTFRLQDHFNNEGSAWTKKYKPIKVLALYKGDDYDEDKYTKMYMDKYGIDNVRGGSYVTVKLSSATIKHLELESTSTNDRCFKCHQSGHYANNCSNSPVCDRCGRDHPTNKCYAKTHIDGSRFDDTEDTNSDEWVIVQAIAEDKCSRCLRTGHCRLECNATKDKYNQTIDECIIC